MNACRLIVDPPQAGDWNMAVDEALLRSAGDGITTLRFYQWSEPTLSLGYFQTFADRQTHAASRDCPTVRRASGGGAIVHDRELTYSIAVPIANRLSAYARSLYAALHESLLEALSIWGVSARLCERPAASGPSSQPQPFLCFERRSEGDVLLANAKICGSAQRRHGRAVLQHGSVILGTSPKAPEVEGIEHSAGCVIGRLDLAQQWSAALSSRLGLSWQVGDLTAVEYNAVEEFCRVRFATPAWV